MRRLLVLLLGAALVLAGCSSDDEGSSGGGDGDVEAFCAMAEDFSAMEEGDVSDEEALELLDELIDVAPRPTIRVALETLRDAVSIPEDEITEEQFGELFGASLVVAAYLEEECGISDAVDADVSLGDGEDEGADGDDGFGDDDEISGVDDVVSPGESPMTLDSIQAAMEDEHGGEAWLEALGSWSVSNERSVTVAPTSEELSADDALAACEALTAYVYDHEPEGSVVVEGLDGAPLAEALDGAECAPVG